MDIKINKVVDMSFVDGPGKRTVVFLQGCTLACRGCQNKALWDRAGGFVRDVDELAKYMADISRANGGNVTISGGEPFQQPYALSALTRALRRYGVAHIISYSGYTWDEIMSGSMFDAGGFLAAMAALSRIDVLVDGRFIKELDDPFITYRGSRNQRPIDVKASMSTGEVVLHDWSNPEIVITEDGTALMPVGLANELADLGTPKNTRMCGQTKAVV